MLCSRVPDFNRFAIWQGHVAPDVARYFDNRSPTESGKEIE